MTEPTRLKELLSKLRVASSVLEYLPALPGYNGSILQIDDTEAARIAKDLDDVVEALSTPQAGGDETPVALTDEQAHAIHSHPFVRDSLLRYVDRPCDSEAADVVRVIYNAANGIMLGATRPTPAAAAEVPTGWKLVPIEPTPDMVEAACCAADNGNFSGEYLRGILKAMLAASPVPPAGVPSDAIQRALDALVAMQMEARARNCGLKCCDDSIEELRAVLSAGAPAVPLQEEQDSDSVHLAAPGSTVPTALTVGTPSWISVDERMPEPGTECIVWSRGNAQHGPYAYLDTWREQREAPVSFSSVTVPVGLGWDSSDFDSITHWMPLPPPPVLCDGRDGVTDSGASFEAAEGTSSSSGPNGHGKDCA